MDEIRPPAGRLIVPFGKLKWASLNTLNTSVRKSSCVFSVIAKVLEIIRSRLTNPGPSMIQAAESPNVNRSGTANAPTSNHRSGVRSLRGRLPSPIRSGRWPPVVLAGFPATEGLKGRPRWASKIGEICQPPMICANAPCLAYLRSLPNGMSHTEAAKNRCGMCWREMVFSGAKCQ